MVYERLELTGDLGCGAACRGYLTGDSADADVTDFAAERLWST